MSERNLPIKLVMQKSTDITKNDGQGRVKFFGEVTPELQTSIMQQFEDVLSYYEDVFNENALVPAVGKITVKPEAIAKSHKPNDLCRNCSIIGSEELNEIYIKVNKKSIEDTIALVQNPPSIRFRANMTAISSIKPIVSTEKVSKDVEHICNQGGFEEIKDRIKIKLFDFDDDFDNEQLITYVLKKLQTIGVAENHELIVYGDKIKFIKVAVNSYEDIIKIDADESLISTDGLTVLRAFMFLTPIPLTIIGYFIYKKKYWLYGKKYDEIKAEIDNRRLANTKKFTFGLRDDLKCKSPYALTAKN